jgi:hypothetical protein
MFSFSFIQDYLSSVHFLVTFISVSIELVLSARNSCFATRILPVMFLLGRIFLGYDSFLLLAESERVLVYIIEGRD